MNKEECLICGAPLEYLNQDQLMECAISHKQELSKTRCVNGHYLCSDCHTQGMDQIFGLCLAERSTDPIAILRRMMELPFCHMHGPEHHVMVGAALLTAYKNAGGALALEPALREMYSRGMAVPGGACGFWGACGAGISAGQFCAIATQSTPLSKEESNRLDYRLKGEGDTNGSGCAGTYKTDEKCVRSIVNGTYQIAYYRRNCKTHYKGTYRSLCHLPELLIRTDSSHRYCLAPKRKKSNKKGVLRSLASSQHPSGIT